MRNVKIACSVLLTMLLFCQLVVADRAGPLLPGQALPPEKPPTDEELLRKAGVKYEDAAMLEYFRQRIVAAVDADKIKELVKKLGDDDFNTRENASAELVKYRGQAEPFLEESLKSDDLEVKKRAQLLLDQIRASSDATVAFAVLRLLVKNNPEGSAEVLLAYLPSAGSPELSAQVQTSLSRVALRNGKPEKAVVDGLADKVAAKRTAAAIALCKGGGSDERKLARKLLEDPDPQVRFHVAQAFLFSREKDVVPVMIELLMELPGAEARAAEEFLNRLAEMDAPEARFTETDEGRKKCRDAWAEWWQKNQEKVDLAGKDLEKTLTKRIALLIKQLDSPKFDEQFRAQKQLESLGKLALADVKAAITEEAPMETQMRLKMIVKRIEFVEAKAKMKP